MQKLSRRGVAHWWGVVVLVGQLAAAQPAPRSVLELTGRGVQIYSCAPGKAGQPPDWVLQGPEAKLTDANGRLVGTHETGPVWRYKDGSAIHGELLSKQAAPLPGAVPWLVLRGVKPEGKGRLTDVVEIRRQETQGGVAPADGCSAANVGMERRVPYSAVYRFFRGSTAQ